MFHEALLPYYPLDRLVLLAVAMLWLAGTVYVRVTYPDTHYSVSLALLTIGGALFIAANSFLLFGAIELVGRLVIAMFFTVAWGFAMWAIHEQNEAFEALVERLPDTNTNTEAETEANEKP